MLQFDAPRNMPRARPPVQDDPGMRFLLPPPYYEEMKSRSDHTPDCYVRPGEYLHHIYLDGVKYVVAQAMLDCLDQAKTKDDADAIRHLELHRTQFESANGMNLLRQAATDCE